MRSRSLVRWLSTRYALRHDAPRTAEDLASFEPWALMPEFRSDYESGAVGGEPLGIQDLYLGFQLLMRAPAIALISEPFARYRLSRVEHKLVLPPAEVVQVLVRNLTDMGPSGVVVLVHDGRSGHSVTAHGSYRERAIVRYLDPWPEFTLLAADHNVAGVAATPDPEVPGGWQVEGSELASVIAAAFVAMPHWELWQARPAPGASDPEGPRWSPPQTDAELALVAPLSLLSGNPASRAALSAAAMAVAELLLELFHEPALSSLPLSLGSSPPLGLRRNATSRAGLAAERRTPAPRHRGADVADRPGPEDNRVAAQADDRGERARSDLECVQDAGRWLGCHGRCAVPQGDATERCAPVSYKGTSRGCLVAGRRPLGCWEFP